jgi:hypothetical protein
MEKKINYLARNFSDIQEELIKFSQKYYPEMTDTFNDASVGRWFIDLMSAVGDDLNYHIDRTYQETNINSSNLKSSVLNVARSNGVKVPGKKASICEVELSCDLIPDTTNISLPNWKYAPIIKRSSIVSSGIYNYELSEDVNFGEQFNDDGFSNRKFSPKRDNNGVITAYTVSKSTIVIGGTSRVYKKVITDEELQPFMEIILPEKDIMNIESIIFKETSEFTNDPQISEYYYDEEEYKLTTEAVSTYRFFEVNSLADQYRFGTNTYSEKGADDIFKIQESYDDYSETDKDGNVIRTTRVYKGEWKPVTQKFITEYTDNGYLKIIFGSGVLYDEIPSGTTTYAQYQMSKLINNDMLGVLPKVGWTMYVLYRVGGGIETNVAQGAINSINFLNAEIPNTTETQATERANVLKSLKVNNISTSVAGKDAPSTEEIKYLTKYNVSSQERCVTLKDYKARLMMMPPKYGCPFRSSIIEENNKIVMSFLGMNANGKLDSSLPQTLVNNIIEYLSHYRSINDYIEMKSGRIYNLGFEVDLFIDKNYNTADVIKTVINTIKDYMDVNNHDMGEDIFIGDLEKSINQIDGVISLIDLRIYNIYSGAYSTDKCPLPAATSYNDSCQSNVRTFFKVPDGANAFEIGLSETENVLYGDYNSMYEILNPESDIIIRAKLK